MNERNSDPFYYETIQCSECCGVDGLLRHKFSEELTCKSCVRAIEEKFNEANRIAEEENCKHDDYRDMSYNELLTERNT